MKSAHQVDSLNQSAPPFTMRWKRTNFSKKADPNQQEGKGASQRQSSHDKYKDKPAQLVARGSHHKGASSSSWEGQTKPGSAQSLAEGDTRGRERVRPISPPSRKTSADQAWKKYKAREVKSPPSTALSRATSYPPQEPTPDDGIHWQGEGHNIEWRARHYEEVLAPLSRHRSPTRRIFSKISLQI